MQRSVLSAVCLLLAVLQVPRVSGTVDIVIGTATILTANQLGALAVLGLGLKVVALKASLLASRGRGRRAAEEVTELDYRLVASRIEDPVFGQIGIQGSVPRTKGDLKKNLFTK